MKASNWIIFFIALAFGLGLGLAYGWAIDPVQYVDVTPDLLRADYRADYVLMVAEAHVREQDAELSARRLAMLGGEDPAKMVEDTLLYAAQNGFTQPEMLALKGLLTAMQTYRARGGSLP